MKTLLCVAGIASLIVSACAEPEPAPVDGVVLPYPASGQQYGISELCQHLQGDGYDVKGTLSHTFQPSDFADLLEQLPALVRGPVESYLADGLTVEVEVQSLCRATNP